MTNKLKSAATTALLLACGIGGMFMAYSFKVAWHQDKAMQACADAIMMQGNARADAIHARCDSLPRADHMAAVDLAVENMGLTGEFKKHIDARR